MVTLLVFIRMERKKEAVANAIMFVMGGVIMITSIIRFTFLVMQIIKKRREAKQRQNNYQEREPGSQINTEAGLQVTDNVSSIPSIQASYRFYAWNNNAIELAAAQSNAPEEEKKEVPTFKKRITKVQLQKKITTR